VREDESDEDWRMEKVKREEESGRRAVGLG
jgi:hypothetical protein